jgi:hypothetical protein
MNYKDRRDKLLEIINSGVTGFKNISKESRMCVKTIEQVANVYPEIYKAHRAQLDNKAAALAESYRDRVEAVEAMRAEGVTYPKACQIHGIGYTSFLVYRKILGIKQTYWEIIKK